VSDISSKIVWATERVLDGRTESEARTQQHVGFRCRLLLVYRGGARRETYVDTYTVLGSVEAADRLDKNPRPSAFHPYEVMSHQRRVVPDWLAPRRAWVQFRYRG
jgi:hypothetical protein